MNLYVAELSELILAHRRDEEFVEGLTRKLSSIFKTLFGDLLWIRYYKTFSHVCRFLYYLSTNGFNLQTLGEEYMQLVQVSDQKRRIGASFRRRFLFIFLEAFSTVILDCLFKWVELTYGRAFPLTRFIRMEQLEKLHRAIFFIAHSRYYSLSKRIAGISYLSLRPQTNNQFGKVFAFIGWSVVVQYLVSLGIEYAKSKRRNNVNISLRSHSKQESVDETDHICVVCSTRKMPVCVPCGHVFCWDCVVEYAAAESESPELGKCPNCRLQFHLCRVVPLLNF